MSINELPDLILARVFYCACNTDKWSTPKQYKLKSWRTKLVLLSTCRVWRELALPIVHQTSFIRCIHTIRHTNGGFGTYSNYSNSEVSDEFNSSDEMGGLQTETFDVKSNLDIIINTNSKPRPRNFHIYIKTSNDPVYSLRKIVEKIRCCATLLNKVIKVNLNFILGKDSSYWTDGVSSIVEASSMGEELRHLIPTVRFIECDQAMRAPVVLQFSKSLIKGYAHQLVGFDYPQVALDKVHHFSENLKYITMHEIGENVTYMPHICTESLTVLDLGYIRTKISWSSFESRGGSRNLHFANLKNLHLRAEVEFNEADSGWKCYARTFGYSVIAPKLEYVFIQLCPYTLSFLASIHDLATIKNVEMKTPGAVITFTELSVDRARELFASYANNSQEDFQTIDIRKYMDDMFSIYDLAENSTAKILDSLTLDVKQIDWRYLLNIEIYCPLRVSDLKNLVSRMSNVEDIYISTLELESDGSLIPEIQGAAVEPIVSKLKYIGIRNHPGYTENELVAYLKKLFFSKLT